MATIQSIAATPSSGQASGQASGPENSVPTTMADQTEQRDESPRLGNGQASGGTCRAPSATSHLEASSRAQLSMLSSTDWLPIIEKLDFTDVVNFRSVNKETKEIVDSAMTGLAQHVVRRNALERLSEKQLAMKPSPVGYGQLMRLHSASLLKQVEKLISAPSIAGDYKQRARVHLRKLLQEATTAHQQLSDKRYGYSWHQTKIEQHLARSNLLLDVSCEHSSRVVGEKCLGYENYNQSPFVDAKAMTAIANWLIERGEGEQAGRLIELAKQKVDVPINSQTAYTTLRLAANLPLLWRTHVPQVEQYIVPIMSACLLAVAVHASPMLRDMPELRMMVGNMVFAAVALPALILRSAWAMVLFLTREAENECQDENRLAVFSTQCQLANAQYASQGESQWRASIQEHIRSLTDSLPAWRTSRRSDEGIVDSLFDIPRGIAAQARREAMEQTLDPEAATAQENREKVKALFEKAFGLSDHFTANGVTLYSDLAKVVVVQQCAAAATDCALNQDYGMAAELDLLSTKFSTRISNNALQQRAYAYLFYEENRAGNIALAKSYLPSVMNSPDDEAPLAIQLLLKASVQHHQSVSGEESGAFYREKLLEKLQSFVSRQIPSQSSIFGWQKLHASYDELMEHLVAAADDIAKMADAQPRLKGSLLKGPLAKQQLSKEQVAKQEFSIEHAIIDWSIAAAESTKDNNLQAVLCMLAAVFEASIVEQHAAAGDLSKHAAALKEVHRLIEKIPSVPFNAKERAKHMLTDRVFACAIGAYATSDTRHAPADS